MQVAVVGPQHRPKWVWARREASQDRLDSPAALMQWNNRTSDASVPERGDSVQSNSLKNGRPFFLISSACRRLVCLGQGSSLIILHRSRGSASRSHDDAVSAGAARDVLLLVAAAGAGAVVVAEATSGTPAVNLDAVTLASDAIALAGAVAAVGAGGAVARERRVGRGAVGAVRQAGAVGRDGRAGEVGDDVLVDVGAAEAGGQFLNGILVAVVDVQDVPGGMGRDGLGCLDLRGRERSALGDVYGQGAALGRSVLGVLGRGRRRRVPGGALAGAGAGAVGLGGGGRRRLVGLVFGDVEDVELAAGGGLDGGLLTGVVRHVVAVDDVVVPVALAGLEVALEAECALPRTGLGGSLILGERELTDVVVPRAKQMDGLDARRDAKRE
jgi:hypothetical protein